MANTTNEKVNQTAADKPAATVHEAAGAASNAKDAQNPTAAVKEFVTGLKSKIFGAIKRPS
jgi:metal-dependent amidase/aminoacylase/carboxypeptidase family protein